MILSHCHQNTFHLPEPRSPELRSFRHRTRACDAHGAENRLRSVKGLAGVWKTAAAVMALVAALCAAAAALAADCATREEMEGRLEGFQPIALGFAGDGRKMEVWANADRVAYFMRLDAGRRTACIVSPRIADFTWLTVMPAGDAS